MSFLGGGCWDLHVPAVVDEITGRAEFVTAYGGGPYADHGKYQAIWEFQSLIGELVGMDVVSTPTYDGITATTSALLMACRLTGRSRVLVPETSNPQLRQHLRTFTQPWATVELIPADRETGLVDLRRAARPARARRRRGAASRCRPTSGSSRPACTTIAAAVHEAGGLLVVAVDPVMLGVLAAPADYGADIVSGDAQALGNHQLFGGGQCGFIAHRDDEAYVRENPSILISAVPSRDGESTGFAWSLLSSTSYDLRGDSRDFTGTSQWLWGIGAAVHLSLLGPSGLARARRGPRRPRRVRAAAPRRRSRACGRPCSPARTGPRVRGRLRRDRQDRGGHQSRACERGESSAATTWARSSRGSVRRRSTRSATGRARPRSTVSPRRCGRSWRDRDGGSG